MNCPWHVRRAERNKIQPNGRRNFIYNFCCWFFSTHFSLVIFVWISYRKLAAYLGAPHTSLMTTHKCTRQIFIDSICNIFFYRENLMELNSICPVDHSSGVFSLSFLLQYFAQLVCSALLWERPKHIGEDWLEWVNESMSAIENGVVSASNVMDVNDNKKKKKRNGIWGIMIEWHFT